MYVTMRRLGVWLGIAADDYRLVDESEYYGKGRISRLRKQSHWMLFPATALIDSVMIDVLGPL